MPLIFYGVLRVHALCGATQFGLLSLLSFGLNQVLDGRKSVYRTEIGVNQNKVFMGLLNLLDLIFKKGAHFHSQHITARIAGTDGHTLLA